jgi:hypothetical protein
MTREAFIKINKRLVQLWQTFFCIRLKSDMENNKRDFKENEKDSKITIDQSEHKPKNPFKDDKKVSNQPSEEEEAELEQERKETLTERD